MLMQDSSNKSQKKKGKVSVNEVRDKLNFGRKLTVQLMEYFDRMGFTS